MVNDYRHSSNWGEAIKQLSEEVPDLPSTIDWQSRALEAEADRDRLEHDLNRERNWIAELLEERDRLQEALVWAHDALYSVALASTRRTKSGG